MAGFEYRTPEQVEVCSENKIQAVDQEMIQVIYSADENQILIRKALGTRNISGDYNNYQKEETITVDEMQVTLKGTFVWEAVKALPDKYREVIHLFHYEGYSTAQIGKMLKRKEATVRSDLRRGRQKLKDILKEAYSYFLHFTETVTEEAVKQIVEEIDAR
ncbi:RNA polymerase sigma factor [Hungatella hominis]|uniref:RNA polymerase sigma factor n=1 Tax=Hungatella TaxID=1649459 RepID=UPI0032E4BF4E